MAQEKVPLHSRRSSRHSPDKTRKPHKPKPVKFCRQLKMFLLELWFIIRAFIDCIINTCFGFYYDDKSKIIPTVKESFLMESAVSLAEKIRNKEIKSEAVVQGFVDRIREVNPVINAVTDDRFDAALEEAREVDKLLESNTLTPDEIKHKPFLGVPFTTKDSTSCKGLKYTLGLVARKYTKAVEDADVVDLMKKAGGILIANTNIPELNLWCETRNNVFGQTLNPYNTTRTVGGSSGGEAAIISSAGSPIGIGTDIGGSIRMPAFFCGIFGHKTTTGLTPLRGLTQRTGKEGPTMLCVGPMSRYVQDLTPMLKVLVGDNVSKLKLDTEVSLKDVRFCFMDDSRDIRASRPSREMRKVMMKAVDHVSDISEHEVKKLTLHEMQYSFVLWRYWQAKEPFDFPMELGNREGSVSIATELLKMCTGTCDFTLAAILKMIDGKLPQAKPDWAEAKTKALLDKLVEELGDNGVLLYPSSPFPASYHYSSFLRPYNFGYWAIFNVLNLPVTNVPMGLSKDGLPVGIQVVAGPYNDHLCLAVARELQQAFGGWVPPFTV